MKRTNERNLYALSRPFGLLLRAEPHTGHMKIKGNNAIKNEGDKTQFFIFKGGRCVMVEIVRKRINYKTK